MKNHKKCHDVIKSSGNSIDLGKAAELGEPSATQQLKAFYAKKKENSGKITEEISILKSEEIDVERAKISESIRFKSGFSIANCYHIFHGNYFPSVWTE